MQHPVTALFNPLFGLPSWLVRRGYGSFVTFEFGQPRLEVREPRAAVGVSASGGSLDFMRRATVVRGQWHLWIYCCDWSLLLDEEPLASSESGNEAIERALGVVDGQAIVDVTLEERGGSRFEFDLGCVLETNPWQDRVRNEGPVEQWHLYQPDGRVLTVRDDGSYRNENGGTAGTATGPPPQR